MALKGAKPPEMSLPIYFDAPSVVDDPGNVAVDPEAAEDDLTGQWADFYNRLYTLIAGGNCGDWSARLSNAPVASQPPANRAPVNTLLADSSPDIAIPSPVVAHTVVPDIGSSSGAESAVDPSAQSAEDTAGSEVPLTSTIDIPLSASLEADKNRPKAHGSGAFRVVKTIVIDADTNDPQRAYQFNDKRRFAQAAVNPGIVLGYMNTRKNGTEGRSWANGDKRDIYLIDALGSEVINLIINYPSQADLDLYLQNAEGETLMTSVGSSPFESLRLPNRVASYYLQV